MSITNYLKNVIPTIMSEGIAKKLVDLSSVTQQGMKKAALRHTGNFLLSLLSI